MSLLQLVVNFEIHHDIYSEPNQVVPSLSFPQITPYFAIERNKVNKLGKVTNTLLFMIYLRYIYIIISI